MHHEIQVQGKALRVPAAGRDDDLAGFQSEAGVEPGGPGVPPVRIRPARPEDSAALAEVQVESYRGAYAGLLPQAYLDGFSATEQEQDWRELLSASTEDRLLVAEAEGDTIAGYVLCRPGAGEISPYDGEVVALHVRRSHQGQCIGRRLLAAAAGQLRQAGCTAPLLWTLAGNPARAWYERLGGRWIGAKDWGGNDEYGAAGQEVAYGWPEIDGLVAAAAGGS
jgi:GNAT superfamily N-acetyltransferase